MSESPHSRGEQPLAAIRYHPRGFDIGGERVMGLQSANSGFLAALARSVTPTETFYGYARSSQDFADFRSRVTSLGMHPGAKLEHIPFTALERLSAPGCLYLAAPALGLSAWHRRFVGNRAYSLCGVTHTMSTDRVMDALVDFLVAPVQTWDALVCTST
ncbi:MAG: glycosyl transferase, partial [Alphaproteobacteria bacterium]|nr:glycosyl transferase [Alphaproteobacteria bacterium]